MSKSGRAINIHTFVNDYCIKVPSTRFLHRSASKDLLSLGLVQSSDVERVKDQSYELLSVRHHSRGITSRLEATAQEILGETTIRLDAPGEASLEANRELEELTKSIPLNILELGRQWLEDRNDILKLKTALLRTTQTAQLNRLAAPDLADLAGSTKGIIQLIDRQNERLWACIEGQLERYRERHVSLKKKNKDSVAAALRGLLNEHIDDKADWAAAQRSGRNNQQQSQGTPRSQQIQAVPAPWVGSAWR